MDEVNTLELNPLNPREYQKNAVAIQKERMKAYEQTGKPVENPNAKQAEIVREVGFLHQMSQAQREAVTIDAVRGELRQIIAQSKSIPKMDTAKPAMKSIGGRLGNAAMIGLQIAMFPIQVGIAAVKHTFSGEFQRMRQNAPRLFPGRK